MAVSFYVGRAFTSSGMDSARPATALPSPGLAVGRGGGAPTVPPAGGGRVTWNRRAARWDVPRPYPTSGATESPVCHDDPPAAALVADGSPLGLGWSRRRHRCRSQRDPRSGLPPATPLADRAVDRLPRHRARRAGGPRGACLGERRTVRALVPLRRTAGDSRVPCIRTSSRDLCGHARGDASTS